MGLNSGSWLVFSLLLIWWFWRLIADREVQRILLELLNQMDGFDQTVNVKVIMATNRSDTLDPALLRPGRLDRKIEFPLPDRRQKRLIFSTITSSMNLSEEVDLEDYVARPDKISGADINAICQEVSTTLSYNLSNN